MLSRRGFGGSLAGAAMMPESGARRRAFEPSGSAYSQAFLVSAPTQWLFVSGQVPQDAAGSVPTGFDAQCRLAWANVERRLVDAGMALGDIVKLTIFLASREHRAANTAIRHGILGDHSPAITIVVADIFDAAWLIEIDVIACR